jgi:cation diffusion facilitator CzcD-associated flavoprotein CzcO
LYSFSFCPNPDWTSLYPEGREIVRYLQGVCDQYEIVDKIQLNTEIKNCRWLESEKVWEMTVRHLVAGVGDLAANDIAQKIKEHGVQSVYVHEEVVRAKIVVSAIGGLVEPKLWPDSIPGKDKFSGEIFHSARWRYDVDLKDKNVVVVGTGCSAAQFVPQLTTKYGAKSVTQLMRSPPWVVPRMTPPLGEKGWNVWAPWLNRNIPGFTRFFRSLIFFMAEYDWRLFGSTEYNERERQKVQNVLLKRLKTITPQKYHEMLTPTYSIGCKRRIFDASWYPGLHDQAVELTTLPLTGVAEDSVTLGPRTQSDSTESAAPEAAEEVTLPADVIILANGFETTRWFHSLDIIGRDGKNLQQVFDERGGPQMYMGTAMDGFPNFYTLYGPNTVTGHTSVIFATECMVNLSLNFIGPVLAGDADLVEIKKEAEVEWARDTQAALKRRVWNTGGCTNWYQSKEGWNSNAYP